MFRLGSKGVGLSYRKTAVLYSAMLSTMPGKAFYAKVDADALLRPVNLLRFLTFLHHVTGAERAAESSGRGAPAIYFGTARGTYNCTSAARESCRSFTFNKGLDAMRQNQSKLTRRGPRMLSSKQRLRETRAWTQLESALMAETEAALPAAGAAAAEQMIRLNNQTSVTFAMGAVYGASREAVRRLVRSRCMERVGAISARRLTRTMFGKQGMHQHEDANFGLCMHLHGVRLVQCSCFHAMKGHSGPSKKEGLGFSWLVRYKYNFSDDARRIGLTPEEALRRVRDEFDDDLEQETDRRPQLCKHPIALHPVKEPRAYQMLWTLLNVRDAANDRELDVWRATAGLNGRATAS